MVLAQYAPVSCFETGPPQQLSFPRSLILIDRRLRTLTSRFILGGISASKSSAPSIAYMGTRPILDDLDRLPETFTLVANILGGFVSLRRRV